MIKRAAVVGGGVIGGGWAARLSLNGADVQVFDIDPDAPRKIGDTVNRAAAAYAKLTAAPLPPPGKIAFAPSAAAAAEGAEIIVEAALEQVALKQKVVADIESGAAENALIASSTSGLLPSELQKNMRRPERFLVAHPFNPVYLIPLVELVGGERTESGNIEKASAMLSTLGMRPLVVRKENDGFIADRLLEAAWREALWMIHDGAATASEIDEAIRLGFGLRWAQMGLFETYRIAGGEGGMRHFLRQFGPSLQWPWSKLTEVPELTEELIDAIATQSEEHSEGRSVGELEAIRDDNLVAFLRALKSNRWGAGLCLREWERGLFAKRGKAAEEEEALRLVSRRAPKHWTDDNGHINESRYLQCFSDASDALMDYVGAGADYIAAGHSYFTAATHLRHLREMIAGEMLHVDSQVLSAEGKKLRVFHSMKNESGEETATGEHLLIHVSLSARRSVLPLSPVAEKVAALAAAHARLPFPEGAGKV